MTYYYEHLPSEPVSASVETPQTVCGAPRQRRMKPILGTITGRRVDKSQVRPRTFRILTKNKS